MKIEESLRILFIECSIEPESLLGKQIMPECVKELEAVVEKAISSYGAERITQKAVKFYTRRGKKKTAKNSTKRAGRTADPTGNSIAFG